VPVNKGIKLRHVLTKLGFYCDCTGNIMYENLYCFKGVNMVRIVEWLVTFGGVMDDCGLERV